MIMTFSNKIRTRTIYAAAVLLLAIPRSLLAQAETVIHEEKTLAWRWLTVAIFTAISVAIAMKNPKRQHQD